MTDHELGQACLDQAAHLKKWYGKGYQEAQDLLTQAGTRLLEEPGVVAPDEDLCVCGHSRKEHMLGGGYCGVGVMHGGCYTSEAQRAHHLANGTLPDAKVCARFRQR